MECRRCHKELPAENFRKHSRRCNKCLAEVAAEYRLKNRPKYLAALRSSYRKYRQERLSYAAQYHAAHKHQRNLERQRITGRIWKENNREKVNAKAAVERALNKGTMVRPRKCSLCPKEGWIVGHHKDYTKPLEVIWVCQSCHKGIHLGSIMV